jgi:hypothetical protein
MQNTVQVQRTYLGWMAPPSALVEIADLVALQAARDLPSDPASGLAVATRVSVTVSASWRGTRTAGGQFRELSGTATEVAAAMANGSPTRVAVAAYAHERGSVLVQWSSWHGCELTVRGEPDWAEETVAVLDQALRPHARWWGRLGSPVRLVVAVVAVVLAALVAGSLSEAQTSPLPYAPLTLALLVGLPPIVARDRWPLPFEFAEPGWGRAALQARLLVAWYALGLLTLLAWLVVLGRS